REDVGYETVSGRLDGVRTRRRIFYLERDTGATIQGAVAPDLLDEIKENLDRPVTARLRGVRTTTIDGRRGRPVYELLEISSETSLFDEPEADTDTGERGRIRPRATSPESGGAGPYSRKSTPSPTSGTHPEQGVTQL